MTTFLSSLLWSAPVILPDSTFQPLDLMLHGCHLHLEVFDGYFELDHTLVKAGVGHLTPPCHRIYWSIYGQGLDVLRLGDDHRHGCVGLPVLAVGEMPPVRRYGGLTRGRVQSPSLTYRPVGHGHVAERVAVYGRSDGVLGW